MIWFVLIFALAVGIAVGLFTQNLKKALSAGVIVVIAGTILSLLIVYSGILGG